MMMMILRTFDNLQVYKFISFIRLVVNCVALLRYICSLALKGEDLSDLKELLGCLSWSLGLL